VIFRQTTFRESDFLGNDCKALKYRMQKIDKKIAIGAPSHNFVGLYPRNEGMYRQSEKTCYKQQYLLDMS